MKQDIKIAVIGGTGKSGKYLVRALINQGFTFKLLVRNPKNFQSDYPNVEVIIGDASDYSSIAKLVKGCHAVISTLGLGIPPSEPTLFSKATTNILQAMQQWNVQRYIVTTGLNVNTPQDQKGPKVIFATNWMYENFPISTANQQLEHDILTQSTADWTLVRLPLIELVDEKCPIAISLEDCPGDKINAASLACFLIEQLNDQEFVKKAPFIANLP
ncbi:NAD(P)H-binding protein [uncultured Flavobacterium sp.]|uniref:NAD(P)-dependent oxidoreductase n=1 Tax=uncultured Flavobacterium sp. TaxID=165435 RepID=UPI0027E02659|nr:NAD(P)H-binding protein [uncultured Flavobacterium sp.]